MLARYLYQVSMLNISDIADNVIVLFEFWIQTSIYIAFLMSVVSNLAIYFIMAIIIEAIAIKVTKNSDFGQFIDDRPFKKGQKTQEMKYGFIACIIFSLVSLIARELFEGVLPESLFKMCIEILAFTLFYETYSYFVHRLLHTKLLRKAHSVHHQSIRVSPWSAFSVHPIEAFFISMSAPLFMLIFDIHLSIIFAFHILGVLFTMILHSNLKLDERRLFSGFFNRYTNHHSAHHVIGNVNFGFVHQFWDNLLKTNYKS